MLTEPCPARIMPKLPPCWWLVLTHNIFAKWRWFVRAHCFFWENLVLYQALFLESKGPYYQREDEEIIRGIHKLSGSTVEHDICVGIQMTWRHVHHWACGLQIVDFYLHVGHRIRKKPCIKWLEGGRVEGIAGWIRRPRNMETHGRSYGISRRPGETWYNTLRNIYF